MQQRTQHFFHRNLQLCLSPALSSSSVSRSMLCREIRSSGASTHQRPAAVLAQTCQLKLALMHVGGSALRLSGLLQFLSDTISFTFKLLHILTQTFRQLLKLLISRFLWIMPFCTVPKSRR
jgi:hypothetical protein